MATEAIFCRVGKSNTAELGFFKYNFLTACIGFENLRKDWVL